MMLMMDATSENITLKIEYDYYTVHNNLIVIKFFNILDIQLVLFNRQDVESDQ